MSKRLDLSYLKDDKIAFIEKLLRLPNGKPFVPFPAQREVLLGITRNTTLIAGRQFGKSVGLGADGAWFATTHPNRQVYCFAPTLDQAKIIWNEIARHFRKPSPLSALVDGKIVEFPFPRLKLLNGTEVHARGANSAKYIRGHPCHRGYVDEAAFLKEGIIGDVIEPMFLVAGAEPDSALILTSTPFGQGEFYAACQAGERHDNPRRTHFSFTAYDSPFVDRTQLEEIKARYGEHSLRWVAEYMGKWPENDLMVFPWADIKWAYGAYPYRDHSGSPEGDERGTDRYPMPYQDQHRYVQGVDLANRSDFFVSTILDTSDAGLAVLVHHDRYQQKGYPFYKRIVRNNWNAYGQCRTLIDATSLGESVVQDLDDIGAEGYQFSSSSAKYEVVQELARMLSEHRLAIPYDQDIIGELANFEYEVTPAKRLKMEARRGHDDIVMSLALGAHLALIPREMGWFQAVELGHVTHPKALIPERNTPGMDHYDPFAELFMDLDEDE